MTFAAPWWLSVGAVVVVAGWLALRRADRRRRRDLETFAASGVVDDLTASLSPTRRRTKRALVLVAAGLCFLALAGPERGFQWERTERRGIDVLVAVDVSRSMLAQDIQPDRLRRAKLAVDDLMRRLGGDRLGLIAFAGTAFLQCPLTLDHAAFQRSLEALEPGIISAPGSNLASALDAARKALASEAKNVKLLVLFSDGEDLGGDAVAAAERAAGDGIRVFTVGVGTPAGELIPLPSDDGPGGFVKDSSGRIVKSRLDEATLRRVAEITEGFYVPLGARAEGVEEIAERALAPIPREELASRLRRVPRNRYQWPLAVAVLLLVAEPFLGERARGSTRAAPARTATRAAVSAVVLAAIASGAYGASTEDAERLYRDKNYPSAAEEYRALAQHDDDPRLDLNLGAASYRAGAFEEAAEAFARALRTEEDGLRERAFYDLGNAQYRLGEHAVASNPQNAASAWEQAIAAYEEAIGLDGGDADARFNRDFVKKKLEELRQQMQQKPPEQDSQSNSNSPQPQDQERRDQNDESGESGQKPSQAPPSNPDQTPEPSDQGRRAGSQDESETSRDHPPAAQPDEKPADSSRDEGPRGGEPKSSGKETDSSAQARAATTTPPGTLSEKEARELLDSLRDEEAVMPVAPMVPSTPPETDDTRDW